MTWDLGFKLVALVVGAIATWVHSRGVTSTQATDRWNRVLDSVKLAYRLVDGLMESGLIPKGNAVDSIWGRLNALLDQAGINLTDSEKTTVGTMIADLSARPPNGQTAGVRLQTPPPIPPVQKK